MTKRVRGTILIPCLLEPMASAPSRPITGLRLSVPDTAADGVAGFSTVFCPGTDEGRRAYCLLTTAQRPCAPSAPLHHRAGVSCPTGDASGRAAEPWKQRRTQSLEFGMI